MTLLHMRELISNELQERNKCLAILLEKWELQGDQKKSAESSGQSLPPGQGQGPLPSGRAALAVENQFS